MSIFVGNLPFRAEREDVTQLFSPFGEVLNCSLPLERDTGRKRGFAFIEMADEAIELTAIDGLQGTELMGRPLRINKATLIFYFKAYPCWRNIIEIQSNNFFCQLFTSFST